MPTCVGFYKDVDGVRLQPDAVLGFIKMLTVSDCSQMPTCVGFYKDVDGVRLQPDAYLRWVL